MGKFHNFKDSHDAAYGVAKAFVNRKEEGFSGKKKAYTFSTDGRSLYMFRHKIASWSTYGDFLTLHEIHATDPRLNTLIAALAQELGAENKPTGAPCYFEWVYKGETFNFGHKSVVKAIPSPKASVPAKAQTSTVSMKDLVDSHIASNGSPIDNLDPKKFEIERKDEGRPVENRVEEFFDDEEEQAMPKRENEIHQRSKVIWITEVDGEIEERIGSPMQFFKHMKQLKAAKINYSVVPTILGEDFTEREIFDFVERHISTLPPDSRNRVLKGDVPLPRSKSVKKSLQLEQRPASQQPVPAAKSVVEAPSEPLNAGEEVALKYAMFLKNIEIAFPDKDKLTDRRREIAYQWLAASMAKVPKELM